MNLEACSITRIPRYVSDSFPVSLHLWHSSPHFTLRKPPLRDSLCAKGWAKSFPPVSFNHLILISFCAMGTFTGIAASLSIIIIHSSLPVRISLPAPTWTYLIQEDSLAIDRLRNLALGPSRYGVLLATAIS